MSLVDLWYLSIAMAAVSLAIMVVIIFARVVSERRAKRLAARRAQMLPRLLAGDDLPTDGPGGRVDRHTTDLLVELIAMVRGDEREQFVALASRVGAEATLIRRLARGKPREKVGAAEALAHFGSQNATGALDVALDDPGPDVRLAAALALSQSHRAPPIALLVERLSLGSAQNSLLLVTLLQYLAEDRSDEVEALLDDPAIPVAVKAAAVDALAAFGRFDIAPTINTLALAANPQGEELARYLRALGTLRHPAGRPAIVRHLDAPTWWVRAAAAEAAGHVGLAETAPQLSRLLDDDDWWVRFRAGEALARIGKEGLDRLRAASIEGTERARTAARMTLLEAGIAADG